MSLPNFICAIAGHDASHIFSTTSSSVPGNQSATFKDLRTEIQFSHHDVNCECGARLTDAWRTNIDLQNYLVDRILIDFDEDELLRTQDTSIHLTALVADHFPRRDASEESPAIQLVFDTDNSPPASFKRADSTKRGEHIVFENSVLMKDPNRSGTPAIPWTSLTDFNQLATTPGVLFVDKTQAWQRCHEEYRVPIVRRPRGYGKTTFLSLLAALHDVHRTDVTFLERSDFPECLVLKFDMNHSTLITSSAEEFQDTLNKYVLDTLTVFMQKYKDHLGLTEEQIQECCRDFPTNGSRIIRVMKIVQKSDSSIFLSIDNYNAPILEKDSHALRNCLEDILWAHFYQFVEGYVIPQAEAGLIVGGILPEGPAQTCYRMSSHFGLGHINGSWDCTESKFAQDMFGLTKGQIQILDAVVNPNGSPRGPDILKDLKFMRIVPQQFATDGDWSTEVMFSMAEVLDVIRLRSSRTRDVEASVIRFEKPLGAKTAVTQNGAALPVASHVTLSQSLAGVTTKYLAKGYTLSDQILQRAIEIDNKRGISKRFLEYIRSLDSKLGERILGPAKTVSGKVHETLTAAAQQAKTVDAENGISKTAGTYYQKALVSPFGIKIKEFYTTTSKQVHNIHEEACRIAVQHKVFPAHAGNPAPSKSPAPAS